MPAMSARHEQNGLQLDIRYPGRDVQPGLALHADGLQRIGIRRTADQKIAAETDPDRGVGADTAVIAREIAAANTAGRCVHRPGKFGLVGATKRTAVTVAADA